MILTILLAYSLALQTPPAPVISLQSQVPSPVSSNQPPPNPVPSKDSLVIALNAQLALMEKTDERLLSTVYWSLGTVVTLAAVLFTFGWFVNFRVYERDKSTLRDELFAAVHKDLAQGRAESANTMKALMEELQETMKNRASSEEANTQRSLLGMTNRIHSVEAAVQKVVDELDTKVASAAQHAVASTQEEVATWASEFGEIRLKFYEIEILRWQKDKVPGNVLSCVIEWLDLAQSILVSETRITRALEALRDALKSDLPTTHERVKLLKLLAQLSPLHADDVRLIREAVSARPT